MKMGDDQGVRLQQGVDVARKFYARIADFGPRRAGKTGIRALRGEHRIDQKGFAAKGNQLGGVANMGNVHGDTPREGVSGVIVEC